MKSWAAPTNRRYYPASPAERPRTVALDVTRGGRASFQVVVRTGGRVTRIAAAAEAPRGLRVRVRRVGYVPLPHHTADIPADCLDGRGRVPGFVPDPLFDDAAIHAGPNETHAFWISVTTAPDAAPGLRRVRVRLTADGKHAGGVEALVRVRRVAQPRRRDFPVTHWFYADALCDWYRVKPWEAAFWRIFAPYVDDAVAHGQDTLYVPVFTPSLDGVKRPTQLLDVRRRGARYTFDWTQVRRWVRTARARGIERFEWAHLFTQWGVKHPIRIYEGALERERLLWPPSTSATAPVYRRFLASYLPELARFLERENLRHGSFFHVSDEPHGAKHVANYRAARSMLRELAPWMPVMDALSDIGIAREGLIDTPIPVIDVAKSFVDAGFPSWTYYCPWPRGRYLNRFLDTPLPAIRMAGWMMHRIGVRGFLHWGFNYWYKSQTRTLIDPYAVNDGTTWPNFTSGDPFVVYPGPAGPIDSLRWEVFAEGLDDLALLRGVGVDRDDPLLRPLHDFNDFPREPAWIPVARRRVLDRLEQS